MFLFAATRDLGREEAAPVARAAVPAPGISPEMGDSGCWRPHAHDLGLGENPTFSLFPYYLLPF